MFAKVLGVLGFLAADARDLTALTPAERALEADLELNTKILGGDGANVWQQLQDAFNLQGDCPKQHRIQVCKRICTENEDKNPILALIDSIFGTESPGNPLTWFKAVLYSQRCNSFLEELNAPAFPKLARCLAKCEPLFLEEAADDALEEVIEVIN